MWTIIVTATDGSVAYIPGHREIVAKWCAERIIKSKRCPYSGKPAVRVQVRKERRGE